MSASAALPRLIAATVIALCVAACSGGGLTTGALLGGEEKPKALPDNNTPAGRALHVGSVAARATMCGYNFDAAKLRAEYLAAEAALGLPIADLQKVENIYDTGFRGVSATAAKESNYCNEKRTQGIKDSLTKVLAADYAPPKIEQQKDAGLFGMFEGDVVAEKGPQFGTGDWWDAQRENKPQ